MKFVRTNSFLISVLLTVYAGLAAAQSKEELLVAATQSIPSHLWDDATVIDRSTDPSTVLRQGTNGITCMTDDPAPGYDASCVDESWFPYGQRMAALRAEGKTLREANKIVNEELISGILQAPNPGALANTVSGPNADDVEVLVTVYLGQEASRISGITSEQNDQSWIMCAGTPQAHLMIGPVRHQLKDVDLKDQCGLD